MTNPYGTAAALYTGAGWPGVLPLPPRRKANPPAGITGREGVDPTAEQIVGWRDTRADGNIALRLPDGVLGIDVDQYGDKAGTSSLAALETLLGPLPPTVMSTSRNNGSGIRLFRVPVGLDWPDIADDIEVIYAGWRYAVVAPSIHPEGRVYGWQHTDGTPAKIPSPSTLPALPTAWVEHLSWPMTARSSTSDADVQGFLAGLSDGAPTEGVSGLLTAFEGDLDGPHPRGAMLRAVEALAVAGAGGAYGVEGALALAKAAYAVVKGSDGVDDFARALRGSVARISDGRLDVYTHADRLVMRKADGTQYRSTPRLEVVGEGLSVADVPCASRQSTWAPLDLSQYLDGDHEGPKATMMPRGDGVFLIYPGLTHSFHGESESGKSMLLQFETVRLIMAGCPVLFVDFESDPHSIVSRLRAFGAT